MKYKEQTMSYENQQITEVIVWNTIGCSGPHPHPRDRKSPAACLRQMRRTVRRKACHRRHQRRPQSASSAVPPARPLHNSHRRALRRAAQATIRLSRVRHRGRPHERPRASSGGTARGAESRPRTGCPPGPARDAGGATACTPPASTRLKTTKAS